MSRGFTLIESVIYIALFGLLIVGSVQAAYQILKGSSITSANTVVQDEGNFVLQKINWALYSAQSANTPTVNELFITRYDGLTVDVKLQGTQIVMNENGGAFYLLTTSNVSVSDFTPTMIPPAGAAPAGVAITGTINGRTFTFTKYLRK